MRAPTVDTGTALRLARIAALVVGCLLFLHACERTRRVVPTDVWIELALAAALGVAAMVVAWFEIARAEELDEAEAPEPADAAGPADAPRECRIESDGRTVRARIAKSGNLVLHGHDHDGPHPGHEWSWTFRPAVFPAIRAALGGDSESDLIELLEDVVLDSRPEIRDDPGAWLRAHGIAAAYREKGDHPSRVTAKLPIFRVGMRRVPETERAKALSRGRAEDELPERSARAASGDESPERSVRSRRSRESVAAKAGVTGSRSRSPRAASETRRAAQIPDSRLAAPVSESRRATNGSAPHRAATASETRRTATAAETHRAAAASETRRATNGSASHRAATASETRRAATAAATHSAVAIPEAADDRPALPRRERTAASERAATRRSRQSYEPPRPAEEPVSDRPPRDRHPSPKRAPVTAASSYTPDRPIPRMPAAAAAYESADRAAPPQRRPAYDAPDSWHSAEPPERDYPPPAPEGRRAHRYL
ncbi:hypothetical protein APR12_002321 [Nocardia amikacinitolerans]|uniref:hypothetical protein n=1 Tax=Nocardia amikacinitolerans TaxID=756689 RepID=UPI000829CFAC|nr:hypothetical protein [Nocardia amikacinitolerans]MCP2316981.1 hypothetical protein [Nocardia amikacinitolerans]